MALLLEVGNPTCTRALFQLYGIDPRLAELRIFFGAAAPATATGQVARPSHQASESRPGRSRRWRRRACRRTRWRPCCSGTYATTSSRAARSCWAAWSPRRPWSRAAPPAGARPARRSWPQAPWCSLPAASASPGIGPGCLAPLNVPWQARGRQCPACPSGTRAGSRRRQVACVRACWHSRRSHADPVQPRRIWSLPCGWQAAVCRCRLPCGYVTHLRACRMAMQSRLIRLRCPGLLNCKRLRARGAPSDHRPRRPVRQGWAATQAHALHPCGHPHPGRHLRITPMRPARPRPSPAARGAAQGGLRLLAARARARAPARAARGRRVRRHGPGGAPGRAPGGHAARQPLRAALQAAHHDVPRARPARPLRSQDRVRFSRTSTLSAPGRYSSCASCSSTCAACGPAPRSPACALSLGQARCQVLTSFVLRLG